MFERATRECRMSPTIVTVSPAMFRLRSRIVNRSSSACVGCSWPPSPALMIEQPTISVSKRAAPAAGWRMTMQSGAIAARLRAVSASVSPFERLEPAAERVIESADRRFAAISKEMRGIAITLAAMLLFALMDAVSKYLSTRYPTPQILWLRYLFTLPLLLVVLPPRRFSRSLPSRRPWLQCCRALLLATEIGLVIWAFGRLPLADVHAVLALTPLVVTGLSMPLLGERVSPRQWAAVAAGFSGVLIVLRPGLDVVQSSTLVVLVAVLLYALYQVLTRLVGRVDGAETSLLWQTAIGSIVLGGVAAFFWQTPALEHWPLFILTAVLGGAGHFLLIRALQMAPVAVTQPFTYTLLLWAVITGYLLFGDLPDQWTVIGSAIVIAAGSYSALQDRQSRHPPQSEHVS